jgi:hypothetical protein
MAILTVGGIGAAAVVTNPTVTPTQQVQPN